MKNTRKFLAILMVFAMIMSMGVLGAFAADGEGTITITNASKGVTYNAYKLFDAELSADGKSITYQGTIPDSLEDIFVENAAGNIEVKAGVSDTQVTDAVQTWAKAQENAGVTPDATDVGDGNPVVLNVPYGYYAVTTTQGSVVSVNSTMPDVDIVDKNTTEPDIEKKVNGKDTDTVTIGDTVTYTATFVAPNYLGEGEEAEQVTKYVVEDTLPGFMADVTITSVVIDQPNEADVTLTATELNEDFSMGFGDDKKITVEWATKNDTTPVTYTSKYENGSKIIVTYTAKVVSDQDIIVDGTVGNVNTVKVTAYTDDDTPDDPWNETWEDSASIFTYAAAFKKVDQNYQVLLGAEFTVNGLRVKGENGLYEVVSYDPTSQVAGDTLTTDDNGIIVIEGLDDDEVLNVIETKAPEGYNKMTGTLEVKPIIVDAEVTSRWGKNYYDSNDQLLSSEEGSSYSKIEITSREEIIDGAETYKVVNHKGTELPETGATGTIIFVAVGSLIAVAAVCFLVTKKRMKNMGVN